MSLPAKATLHQLLFNERGRITRAATVSIEIFNHLGYATRTQLLEGRLSPAECAEFIQRQLMREGRIDSTAPHPPGAPGASQDPRSAKSRRASSGG